MSENSTIRILLVDDHFIVRSGLVASLELEDDLKIVAEAERGEDALPLFQTHEPDLVLMDLQLPGINGIEATLSLTRDFPAAKVLMFSTFARDDEINAALEAGALGYLQKSAERGELVATIRAVAAGKLYLADDLAERLRDLRSGPKITVREREILALIARGKANKEIAEALGIAEDTVKRHASNVFQKFGVNDRAGATSEAIRRGIVKIEP